MAAARNTTKKSTGKNGKRGVLARMAARVFFWGALICLVAGILVGGVLGTRYVLLTGNPHFTCRRINVTTNGQVTVREIIELLSDSGVQEGRTNIFAVAPGELRESVLRDKNGLVNNVTVVRRLPGELDICIYERQPVAQLTVPRGLLIDEQGWILPARFDAYTLGLPIITGIRNAKDLRVQTQTEDPMVKAALELLRLSHVRSDVSWLQLSVIQLDYSAQSLKLHLKGGGTFRKDARVMLPVKDLPGALQRVYEIVKERLRARQTTSYIDATYERNVPVRE